MTQQDPTQLNAQYNELVRTDPNRARQLKRDNPGLGCVWANPNVPGAGMFLMDPETGTCVHDQFGEPVTTTPGMTASPKPGVTAPPPSEQSQGPTQPVTIDAVSLCRELRVPEHCANAARQHGIKMIARGRLVQIQSPKPVILTVAQARKLGLLTTAQDQLAKLETWFESNQLGKVGFAATKPFADSFADGIEGLYMFLDSFRRMQRKSAVDMFRELPNAAKWARTGSGRPLRIGTPAWAVNYLQDADKSQMNEILQLIQDSNAPPDAVRVDVSGAQAKVWLENSDTYCVPQAAIRKQWVIRLPPDHANSRPSDAIAKLRDYGGLSQQEVQNHPALYYAYTAGEVVRDAWVAGAAALAAGTGMVFIASGTAAGASIAAASGAAVAIGIGAVALLAFLGSAVANQSQKGPDFWFTAILDTLISITKSKIVQRITAYLNPKTFGPAVEAAVDFIAILLEDALRGLLREMELQTVRRRD